MSDFIREARYYVIKQKNLTEDQDTALCDLLSGAQIPCTDCVVVEKDWRNYEHTWKTIEHVASGKFCDPYEEIDRLHLHIEQAHARLQSVHADLLEIHRVTAHVAGWTGEPLREDHLTVRRVKEMSIWLNRTVQELDRSRARVADLEKIDAEHWWKLGMANARQLIKANKATSNGKLFMNLFGTGFGTARSRCRQIGLNPDSNETSLSIMTPFLGEDSKAGGGDE
jgi:hypothetical protein